MGNRGCYEIEPAADTTHTFLPPAKATVFADLVVSLNRFETESFPLCFVWVNGHTTFKTPLNEESMSDETIDRSEMLGLTAQIVSAYVENNRVESQNVTELLETVFGTLSTLSKDDATSEIDLVPAVPELAPVSTGHPA